MPNWFESLEQMRASLADWRRVYNEPRPRSSIGDVAPAEYASKLLMASAV